jgi:hypothetical protein|tara:strand:- start:2041 stop:2214 length:174 start_codon:yes stop_codon:yes gene_type:complete
MDPNKKDDKPLVIKITCCFKPKKEEELMVSTGVVKLNANNKRDSPKKKKNTQNAKSK